jgi:hypothetical protein
LICKLYLTCYSSYIIIKVTYCHKVVPNSNKLTKQSISSYYEALLNCYSFVLLVNHFNIHSIKRSILQKQINESVAIICTIKKSLLKVVINKTQTAKINLKPVGPIILLCFSRISEFVGVKNILSRLCPLNIRGGFICKNFFLTHDIENYLLIQSKFRAHIIGFLNFMLGKLVRTISTPINRLLTLNNSLEK